MRARVVGAADGSDLEDAKYRRLMLLLLLGQRQKPACRLGINLSMSWVSIETC